MVFWLHCGLYFGLMGWFFSGFSNDALFLPLFCLRAGLIAGLFLGLEEGVIKGIQVKHRSNPTRPNQGTIDCLRSGLRMMLVFGLFYALFFGLTSRLFLPSGLFSKSLLLFGLLVGLVNGLGRYGGKTVVQHYILRWLLAREGALPSPFKDQSLIAYLDAMKDRIFLRRVGGGWVFIHRTLLDYFASLHPAAAPELAGANHPDASEGG